MNKIDDTEKYYDKNKNNQIVLGRGLEMDSIN